MGLLLDYDAGDAIFALMTQAEMRADQGIFLE